MTILLGWIKQTNLSLGLKEEKMFLSSFANGEYKPQLLFEDKSILENIKYHPMASWQIQKIQEQLKETPINSKCVQK